MKGPPLPNDIIISIIQMENKRWAREQKILAQHKKHKNKMKPIFYLLNEISNPTLARGWCCRDASDVVGITLSEIDPFVKLLEQQPRPWPPRARPHCWWHMYLVYGCGCGQGVC